MKLEKTILTAAATALLALGLNTAPAAAAKVIVTPGGTYVKSHHVVRVVNSRAVYGRHVSMRVARRAALARVPRMKVRSETFTRIGARPVYVFTLYNARMRGLTQVTVDARSGYVLRVRHLGRY